MTLWAEEEEDTQERGGLVTQMNHPKLGRDLKQSACMQNKYMLYPDPLRLNDTGRLNTDVAGDAGTGSSSTTQNISRPCQQI